MNPADIEKLKNEKLIYPNNFRRAKVLELGSRTINGTVRDCFSAGCEFVGVDWVMGHDVDVQAKFHELDMQEEYFDTLISYSTWEHDPHWKESIKNCLRFLKKGGMIFFNWAGKQSSEHGLSYSADLNEYTDNLEGHYYPKSLEEMTEYLEWLDVEVIDTYREVNRSIGEILYLTGKK